MNALALLDERTRYRLLKLLEENPELSQRELARALGVSLGKVNYCLRALLARGLVKVRNFRDSRNKIAYAYYLTPRGAREKVRATALFLRRRLEEYRALEREIEELRREARAAGAAADGIRGS